MGELSCPLTSASPFAPGSSSGPPDQPRLVIEVHPSRTAVSQGSEVTLRCLVRGDPPHFFYWSREDGRPVPSAAQLREQGESASSPNWADCKLGGGSRGGETHKGRGALGGERHLAKGESCFCSQTNRRSAREDPSSPVH